MLCPNCGTIVEDTAEKCECCGYEFLLNEMETSPTSYKEDGSFQSLEGIQNDYNKHTLKTSNESSKALTVFLVVFVLIIAILVIVVKYQANENLKRKYENLSNTYGLSFQEIEDEISNYYYRTWYDSSGNSLKISKDKLIDPTGTEESLDYKVTKIYREKETSAITVYITAMETTIKIQPYTLRDENNIKLYDWIVLSDPNDPDAEYEYFYDRPIQDIFS